MPTIKHKRKTMLATSLLLLPFLIIIAVLTINQANLFSSPGFSARLKLFLTTNVAEVKVGATLPELEAPEYTLSPADLFKAAELACQQLGWEVTEANAEKLVIQSVVSTQLIGFKDNVTITIEKIDNGSRLNAISRSRVGRGDLAANSHHLQLLLKQLKQH